MRHAVPVNDIKCKLRWCKTLHGFFSSGPLLLNSDQLMTKTLSAQLRWHHWWEPTQLFWKPDQSHQTTQSNLTLANLNFSDGTCFRGANAELTKLVRLKVELRWLHSADWVSMVTSKTWIPRDGFSTHLTLVFVVYWWIVMGSHWGAKKWPNNDYFFSSG